MPSWAVTPIEEVPELVLVDYIIAETDIGQRHFIGYNVTEMEGRVSSAIQQFDVERRLGATRSGRVYELRGRPGVNLDAQYTWARWCDINGVKSWTDVTKEVLGDE